MWRVLKRFLSRGQACSVWMAIVSQCDGNVPEMRTLGSSEASQTMQRRGCTALHSLMACRIQQTWALRQPMGFRSETWLGHYCRVSPDSQRGA